jgi:hypothetical protein
MLSCNYSFLICPRRLNAFQGYAQAYSLQWIQQGREAYNCDLTYINNTYASQALQGPSREEAWSELPSRPWSATNSSINSHIINKRE